MPKSATVKKLFFSLSLALHCVNWLCWQKQEKNKICDFQFIIKLLFILYPIREHSLARAKTMFFIFLYLEHSSSADRSARMWWVLVLSHLV